MKRRIVCWFGVLLTVLLSAVLLTGCPNVTEEEREQLRNEGREILKQALLANYGWEENDYQILSAQETPKSADGFAHGEYRLKKGDTEVTAYVDISKGEVFTDYYGEEFGEVLITYLKQKTENSPILQELSLQFTSVTIYPRIFYFIVFNEKKETIKMIPATITPDGFEAYLENCEQDESMHVVLKAAWYSEELKELPKDLLKSLLPSGGKLPTSLIIEHFACKPEDAEQQKKPVETLTFPRDVD